MKKIFTIMIAMGTVIFVSAQPTSQKNSFYKGDKKDVKQMPSPSMQQGGFDRGKSNVYEMTSFSTKEKDAAIQKINRRYDQEIAAIKKNRRLWGQEKSRQIRLLENKRSQEIKEVQLRWEKSNRHDKGQNRNKGHY